MLVAHLVHLSGDLSGARLEKAVAAVRAEVVRKHERHCSAVTVDLSDVSRMPAAFADHLRALRQEAHDRVVVLSVTAPRDSPAHRVLDFYQHLGEPLPPVYTERPPWIDGSTT